MKDSISSFISGYSLRSRSQTPHSNLQPKKFSPSKKSKKPLPKIVHKKQNTKSTKDKKTDKEKEEVKLSKKQLEDQKKKREAKIKMKMFGPHLSASGGAWKSIVTAHEIGATAFGLFLRNQRRWEQKPIKQSLVDKFRKALVQYEYDPKLILPHNSYLVNLGSPSSLIREKSLKSLIEELQICDKFGLKYLNIHPGSCKNEIKAESSIKYITENINEALNETKNIIVVLETTAGSGGTIGGKFEDIAQIIEGINDKDRIGVCIDTCHIFVAGYDIREESSYKNTFDEFEKKIGFNYLKAIHLNDSLAKFKSNTDRHAPIGDGELGKSKFFELFMNDDRFNNMPCIIETVGKWEKEKKFLLDCIH